MWSVIFSFHFQQCSLGSLKSVQRYRVKQIFCEDENPFRWHFGRVSESVPLQGAPSKRPGKPLLSPRRAVQAPPQAASSKLLETRSSDLSRQGGLWQFETPFPTPLSSPGGYLRTISRIHEFPAVP